MCLHALCFSLFSFSFYVAIGFLTLHSLVIFMDTSLSSLRSSLFTLPTSLKVTLLGTGTSGGVPSLGCQCDVCRSIDPRDRRLRCVALVESATTRVLIDCGPDIRQQLMPLPFKPFDAILLTHIHYDHVGGIDDLRPFSVFGPIRLYGDQKTCQHVRNIMPYCFGEHLYPGVPKLELHEIAPHVPLHVGDLTIVPIQVMHGKMPILGFRIGSFAYITDMKTIADTELPYLEGVETLVVNALRFEKDHHSHQLVDDAVRFARHIGAKQTYITHVCHHIGLYTDAQKRMPEGVVLAYDGEVITVDAE